MKDARLNDMEALVRDKSDILLLLDNENQYNAKRADVNQKVLELTILSHRELRNYGEEQQHNAKM